MDVRSSARDESQALHLSGRAVRPNREFFIDNLLVRIYFIIVMIRWTGLAPWEFEFPFSGGRHIRQAGVHRAVDVRSSARDASQTPHLRGEPRGAECARTGVLTCGRRRVQGYLAHKKPAPPRTLQ